MDYPVSSGYQSSLLRDHPFSTYAKCLEKLTFLTPWYAHVPLCHGPFRRVQHSKCPKYGNIRANMVRIHNWALLLDFLACFSLYRTHAFISRKIPEIRRLERIRLNLFKLWLLLTGKVTKRCIYIGWTNTGGNVYFKGKHFNKQGKKRNKNDQAHPLKISSLQFQLTFQKN